MKRETQPEGRGGRNLKLVGRIWDDNCSGRMRGGVKIVLEEALVKIWCSEEAVGVEDGGHCGRGTEMVGKGKAGGGWMKHVARASKSLLCQVRSLAFVSL